MHLSKLSRPDPDARGRASTPAASSASARSPAGTEASSSRATPAAPPAVDGYDAEAPRPRPWSAGRPAIAAERTGPTGPERMTAAEIRELSGPLSNTDLARLALVLPWLSPAQMGHLETSTDLCARAPDFRAMCALRDEIGRVEQDHGRAYDHAVGIAHREGLQRHLTPALLARLVAVLLTGSITQHLKDDLRCLLSGLSGPPEILPGIPRGNLFAIRRLLEPIYFRLDRELFLRAFAHELAQREPALLERLIMVLGAENVKRLIPTARASAPKSLAAELVRRRPLAPYFAIQHSPSAPVAWQPSEEIRLKIAAAVRKIEAADAYARQQGVTLASPPEQLAEARARYADARDAVRSVLKRDRAATRDPAINAWLTRRIRALFVHGTFREALRGREEPTPEKLASAMATLAGLKPPPATSRLDAPMAELLSKAIGGRSLTSPTAEDGATLVRAISERLLADPTPDPLIDVMLDPRPGRTKHVYVLYAPGIIPIPGIMEGALAQVSADTGVSTVSAETGLFDFAEKNAEAVEKAMRAALAEDAEARFFAIGYSQGTANVFTALDALRTRSPSGRALAERVVAVGSLYGAHNGSTIADEFVPNLVSVLDKVPFGRRIEVGLSAFGPVAQLVAGGIQSMKRDTRRHFEELADLPTDIPFISLTAHPRSADELPNLLKANYRQVIAAAQAKGLPTENDSQVLACDGPLGNERSPAGRVMREAGVELKVRGHHWNPVGPEHVPFIEDPLDFSFPKAPQVGAMVELLAEHALLSPVVARREGEGSRPASSVGAPHPHEGAQRGARSPR